MNERDDGGPAFPQNRPPNSTVNGGMTLRDYFAAKAMQAVLASNDATAIRRAMEKAQVQSPDELFARNAYQMADAMLKERAK